MSQDKKDLKIFCILFYVFAVLELIEAAVWLYIGFSGNTFGVSELETIDASTLKITTILCGIICLITCGMEFFLGNRGKAEIKGTYSGTAHLKVAAILGVFCIIGCALAMYGVIVGLTNWFDLISEALAVILMFTYRDYCKRILADNKK